MVRGHKIGLRGQGQVWPELTPESQGTELEDSCWSGPWIIFSTTSSRGLFPETILVVLTKGWNVSSLSWWRGSVSENDSSQVVKTSESFFILTFVSSSRVVKSEPWRWISENSLLVYIDFIVRQIELSRDSKREGINREAEELTYTNIEMISQKLIHD